ncbi:hypothetical protein BDW74DRAFT_168262 [Aspergillus multicolor]|uniref:uncharacterized protein n=1 Tax=Aspergillus multicolor TaxID=41759 RepID=UPI003CCE0D8D
MCSFVPDSFKYQHAEFKHRFEDAFWPAIDQDINGAFNCEYDVKHNHDTYPKVSWTCFKIKEVSSAIVYAWRQPCIYIDWDSETGRQLIYIFDFLSVPVLLHSRSKEDDPAMSFLTNVKFEERRRNPFAWHNAFTNKILERYEKAYWSLLDLVRLQEKAYFLLLHHIARHIFHYKETVEVAEHTLEALIAEQERWRQEDEHGVQIILGSWLKTHQGLLFEARRAHSLRCRVECLRERHMNQISLAFNSVAQESGRAASSGSSALKSILVLSLVYLPGIFISEIFGTNFFAVQSDTFTVSSRFWIYWVTAIPLTLITILVWAMRHYYKKLLSMHRKNMKEIYMELTERHDAPARVGEKTPMSPTFLARSSREIYRAETV